ncbi:Protocadherin-16 [Armadillidium vulgare]|nr:Protocadherin-16 [Armadillidium vulgare]
MQISDVQKELQRISESGVERIGKTPLTIHVKDVQNTPPIFHGSKTGIISEDAPIGSLVMVLQAEDGDVGDPRSIMYELTKNPLGFFLLDPESGELRTAKPLDRESVPDPAGVLILIALVSETAAEGTVVASIAASDLDTGRFGTDGIRYSLFGNGAER